MNSANRAHASFGKRNICGDSSPLRRNANWDSRIPHSAVPTPHSNGPTHRERLEAESNLFGFAISGHPLELFADVAWDSYCPVNQLGQFVGQVVTTCGLVVEQRTHHQITGEPMKFLTLADWTGMVETELFAKTYKVTAW